ncbi:MAG: alpha/beta hydrolase [Anaerolineaceae bacterium]|nr:alpha/beta hydrolase [Anaerolineaceae bacterium]
MRNQPAPGLLIYGSLDDQIPVGTVKTMAAAACKPSQIWQVAGAGHGNYAQYASEEYAARLIRFFSQ